MQLIAPEVATASQPHTQLLSANVLRATEFCLFAHFGQSAKWQKQSLGLLGYGVGRCSG